MTTCKLKHLGSLGQTLLSVLAMQVTWSQPIRSRFFSNGLLLIGQCSASPSRVAPAHKGK